MVIVHTFFLLMRTYLSLLVAKLDGIIVRDLVTADLRGFVKGLVYWYLLAIPSTYTNSMVRHLFKLACERRLFCELMPRVSHRFTTSNPN